MGGTNSTNAELHAEDAHLAPMIDINFGLPYSVTARSGLNLLGTGLSMGGAIQWMSLTITEASIDLIDTERYVAWSPLPLPLCIFGGYRYLDYTIDIKGNEKKYIGGPFAGVSLSF